MQFLIGSRVCYWQIFIMWSEIINCVVIECVEGGMWEGDRRERESEGAREAGKQGSREAGKQGSREAMHVS